MFKNIWNYLVILLLYYSSVSSAKVELMENIGNLKDDEIVCFTAFLKLNEDIESKKDIINTTIYKNCKSRRRYRR